MALNEPYIMVEINFACVYGKSHIQQVTSSNNNTQSMKEKNIGRIENLHIYYDRKQNIFFGK